MSTLQITWFFLLGILLTVYALLDGFDLGVGAWYLLNKDDRDRRTLMTSIGPFWDGNEVWLLLGGGAIFAAFPPVYASVFSGLYLALILLLVALIFRATSLEFRNKVQGPRWRSAWDLAFGLGSALAALLFPVALGNLLNGMPLDAGGNYTGSFWALLNPYALLIGLTGFTMILVHGALYIAMKTEGPLGERGLRWAGRASLIHIALFLVASAVTVASRPELLLNFKAVPVLWGVPSLALVFMVATRLWTGRGRPGMGFAFSCLSIIALMGTAGASLFPRLVIASNEPGLSLTVANASSSELSLTVMLVIVLIGLPLVTAYTVWIYRRFRGKVQLEEGAGYGH